nr:hypothetical protein [Enterocloster clostridioformis]
MERNGCHDSGHQFRAGISPVSRYSGYDGDETGSYDLTVMAVTSDFFTQMDEKVKTGQPGRHGRQCGASRGMDFWGTETLTELKGCFKAAVFVNSADDFGMQPQVVNGGSNLIAELRRRSRTSGTFCHWNQRPAGWNRVRD